MNEGDSHARKRRQTNKDSQERGPLTKEPGMKRGKRGAETHKKATKEAKGTKGNKKKKEGLELKYENKK